MRQGPDYSQHVDRDEKGNVSFRPPLEIVEDIGDAKVAVWHDNGDGSYTITLRSEI